MKVIRTPDYPVAETTAGGLHGYKKNDVYHFYGIKYGEAKRFELPQMPEPWSGIRDAKSYGHICPLMPEEEGEAVGAGAPGNSFEMPHRYWPMNEDCLYLNIWTQSLDPAARKPVMVWLHGGGYGAGSAIEQPAYEGYQLCDHGDVVVVNLNHRLNCIGYLDLSDFGEEYAYTGCLGMADIILALKWVQENITVFGGDPDCVTIFGQSGGGNKVLTLMQMPEADGLYHRAVIQSGIFPEPPEMTVEKKKAQCRELGRKTAEVLGLTKDTIHQIDTIEYDVLAQAANEAGRQLGRQTGMMLFEPAPVENYYIGSYQMAGMRAETKHIPVIIGTTLGEFSFGQYLGDKSQYKESERKHMFTEKFGSGAEKVSQLFRSAYPEKDGLYALSTDTMFRLPAIEYVQTRSAFAEAPVYNYLFSVIIPYLGGVTPWHCAEIPYIFRNVEMEPVHCCGYEYMEQLTDEVSNAWLAFAKTGKPGTEELDWPAYENENPVVMYFDRRSGAEKEKDRDLILCLIRNMQR